jgi:hypothetical protein
MCLQALNGAAFASFDNARRLSTHVHSKAARGVTDLHSRFAEMLFVPQKDIQISPRDQSNHRHRPESHQHVPVAAADHHRASLVS